MENKYLHGYTPLEQQRLISQADLLSDYIYPTFDFSNTNSVLEVGCGNGAQTIQMLRRYPHLKITAIDISAEQISKAKQTFSAKENARYDVQFIQSSIENLEMIQTFDVAFVCWVLEHVKNPKQILKTVKRHLSPKGKVYITEVYNNSFDFSPKITSFWNYYNAYNLLQTTLGGNPNVGINLGTLLSDAGYNNIRVLPSINFHDKTKPNTRKIMFEYWFELMMSAKKQLIDNNMLTDNEIIEFENDYIKIYEDPNSYFYYCAFQAIANV